MEHRTHGSTATEDAALVSAALDGDREAVAGIYARYADRVHSMCLHMLDDRSEAEDVCGDVFLVAFQRLGQLREPSKLKAWLFAIARHEVYKRTRRARRTRLIEEVEEMDRLVNDGALELDGDHEVDQAALAALLRDAAGGLDDRDRLVMELELQGLDGAELADALGTSASTAYQQVHRMKERLERSIGAVLVARQGRVDCDELDAVLAGWDGTFTVLWRKRVARHVERCEICTRRRKAVPALLLGGAAVSLPMVGASSVSAAPASVRDRVLADADVASGGPGWRRDGFPSADGRFGRIVGTIVAVAVVLLVLALTIAAFAGGGGGEVLAGDDVAATPSTTTSTTTTEVTTTTAVPAPSTAPSTTTSTTIELIDPAPIAPPAPAPPLDSAPPAADPPAPPPAPEPPPVRTLEVTWAIPPPSTVFHPAPSLPDCSASQEHSVRAIGATSVQLWWTGSGTSGVVELTPTGEIWSGVLELPASVPGPLEVVAVASAPDALGTGPLASAVVANCPLPG